MEKTGTLFDLIPPELIRSVFLYVDYDNIKELTELYPVFEKALVPEIFWQQKLLQEFETDYISILKQGFDQRSRSPSGGQPRPTDDTYRSTYAFLHQLIYNADPFLYANLPEYKEQYDYLYWDMQDEDEDIDQNINSCNNIYDLYTCGLFD